MGHSDDTSLMVMVCLHNVSLFVANIDAPGEEQKIDVSLIEHMIELLPPEAYCVFIINVGRVFDVSFSKASSFIPTMITDRLLTPSQYEIIPDIALNCIKFCTAAMHAYMQLHI